MAARGKTLDMPDVNRLSWVAVAACLFAPVHSYAQSPTIDELKGKIFDARMTKQTFAGGLRHCTELNGDNFYFQQRDRVLNLQEYHQSLQNLVAEHVFNPETHRPWTEADAAARWERVKQGAAKDKSNCDLVASLPQLEKQLEELEHETGAPAKQQ
jgi:methyl coenzyme M reductase beta subunit